MIVDGVMSEGKARLVMLYIMEDKVSEANVREKVYIVSDAVD